MSRFRALAIMTIPFLLGAGLWLYFYISDLLLMREPPPDLPPLKIHVVKQGDTLWRIARMYYDDSVNLNAAVLELRRVNNWVDPGKLRIGDRLVIPSRIP